MFMELEIFIVKYVEKFVQKYLNGRVIPLEIILELTNTL